MTDPILSVTVVTPPPSLLRVGCLDASLPEKCAAKALVMGTLLANRVLLLVTGPERYLVVEEQTDTATYKCPVDRRGIGQTIDQLRCLG